MSQFTITVYLDGENFMKLSNGEEADGFVFKPAEGKYLSLQVPEDWVDEIDTIGDGECKIVTIE